MSQLSTKLIEGAGKAVQSSGPVITRRQIRDLKKGGVQLAESINNYIKKRQKVKTEEKQLALEEWVKVARKYATGAKGLSEADKEVLFFDLEAGSEAFANTPLGRKGERERNDLMSSLESTISDIAIINNFKDDLSNSIRNIDGDGLVEDFKLSMAGVDYMQFLNGDIPISRNEETGEWGAVLYNPNIRRDLLLKIEKLENDKSLLNIEENETEINDINEQISIAQNLIEDGDLNPNLNKEWMSIEDMRQVIQLNSFDLGTSAKITDYGQTLFDNAYDSGEVYDENRGEKVARLLLNDASVNFRSIVKDKHAGLEVSFEDALVNYLHNLTYSDLDINYDDIAPFDPDEGGDGSASISIDDAKIIVEKLTNSKEMTMPYIIKFFSIFFANQNAAGLKKRNDEQILLNATPL